jgi:hypothetical protein
MTPQQQRELADEMMFHCSHEQEMKLRRMAADAALSSQQPIRFAVIAKPRQSSGISPWDLGSMTYHQPEVNLHRGITDHDMRVLVAEAILRPQLRAAGWRV